MIIARDVKIVTSTATTLFARVAYNIFSTIEQKNEKKTTRNNSSVLCVVCEKCNEHSLFARFAIKILLH
ncbi:unnamed protein product [Tenebrio molitor]|nr:unnamed protein product [Tenebrio molitor]